jgi:CBS domain-containing protein
MTAMLKTEASGNGPPIPTPSPFRASAAWNVDLDRTLEHLERATPVRLIGTFNDLVTAYTDEPAVAAAEKARPDGFDYLPVRDRASGLITGLFETRMVDPAQAGNVSEYAEPLGVGNLIAGETPLLRFLYQADTSPCRLILEATQITGIVTVSDLQKLPVRTALFSLFIHLEILLTELLRRTIGGADPFTFLSAGREEKAEAKWQKFKDGNVHRDRLSVLDFCDKRTIAEKHKILGLRRKQIEDELTDIEFKLRNPIAHGADYAASQQAAFETARVGRVVEAWIGRLRSKLGLGTPSP